MNSFNFKHEKLKIFSTFIHYQNQLEMKHFILDKWLTLNFDFHWTLDSISSTFRSIRLSTVCSGLRKKLSERKQTKKKKNQCNTKEKSLFLTMNLLWKIFCVRRKTFGLHFTAFPSFKDAIFHPEISHNIWYYILMIKWANNIFQ